MTATDPAWTLHSLGRYSPGRHWDMESSTHTSIRLSWRAKEWARRYVSRRGVGGRGGARRRP